MHHALGSTFVQKDVSIGDHQTVLGDSNPASKSVPIILIHASALDGRMWDEVFARLVTQISDSRVIAYDIRGHGYAGQEPHAESLQPPRQAEEPRS